MATTETAAASRRRNRPATRRLETPEGVPLTLELADRGERAGAFLIDLAVMFVALVLLIIAVIATIPASGRGEWVVALYLLASFLLRTFYFFGLEVAWQGRTIGKRMLGLRVVDRRGGQLTVGALAARNMLREIEFFLPLSFLLLPVSDRVDASIVLLSLIWLGILTLMPLFNRDRMRLGDMVGGTWVVVVPKAGLERDLTSAKTETARRWLDPHGVARNPRDREGFSRAELDVYGIKELQILEGLLRAPDVATTWQTMRDVANRIRRKIGREELPVTARGSLEDKAFLEDYYTALRAHLEQHMLFGDRRDDKNVMAQRHGAGDKARPDSVPPSQDSWHRKR